MGGVADGAQALRGDIVAFERASAVETFCTHWWFTSRWSCALAQRRPQCRRGKWLSVSQFGYFVAEVRAWEDLARCRLDVDDLQPATQPTACTAA